MTMEIVLKAASPGDFNIVIGDFVTEKDIELMFSGEIVCKMPENIRFPVVMRLCGVFKSNNEARRNGWDKDIPEGFSEWVVGKKAIRITILKATKERIDVESQAEVQNIDGNP